MPNRSWLSGSYLRAARQVVACGIGTVRQLQRPRSDGPGLCGIRSSRLGAADRSGLNRDHILWSVANGDALRNDPTFKALNLLALGTPGRWPRSSWAGCRATLTRDRLLTYFAQQPPAKEVLEACRSAHHCARQLNTWDTPSDYCRLMTSTGMCDATRPIAPTPGRSTVV